MTISSTDRQAGPFNGNGATVAFPFEFKVFSAADLQVIKTTAAGDETTLSLDSEYTVSLNADQNADPGGTVTAINAPATGEKLTVTSDLDPLQSTDLTNQGGFYPQVITASLDRLTILIQQIYSGLNRAIKFSISSGGDGTLPASDRAGKALGFDANGNPVYIELSTGTSLASLVASGGSALVGWIQSLTGAVARTVQSKLRESISLYDFGAVGDGVTDDTVAIQKAVDSGAMRIFVPATANGFRTTAPISITRPITLEGEGTSPYGDSGPYTSRGKGSWFFLDHAGVGFYAVKSAGVSFIATVRYLRIGTYRNHLAAIGPGWAPTVFAADFVADNTDVMYQDLLLLNPYIGITHLNGNAGRVTIDNVRGQWFHIGINIDVAMDTVRISNLHHWPFWSNNANVTGWMQANTTNISLNRCDNPMLSNVFSIYTNINLGIYQNASGTVSKLRVTNMDADFSNYPIYVDASVNNATGQFVNLTTYGPAVASTNNYGVRILGSFCRFDFTHLEGSNLSRGLLKTEGSGNVLKVSGIRVSYWDGLAVSAAIVDNGAGNTLHLVDEIISSGTGTVQLTNAGSYRYAYTRSGTAIIPNGSTSITVTHNLPITPTNRQISIWLVTGIGSAKEVWLDSASITSTQFTIRCDINPGANVTVGWRASFEY